MRADEVRDVFERVDAEPSAEFSDALLARLRAEYRRAGLETSGEAGDPTLEPFVLDDRHEGPPMGRGRRPERRRGHRSRRTIALGVAAAAAVIVATFVLVDRADDTDVDVVAGGRPAPVPTVDPPAPAGADEPRGLPPERATPSSPETGQLLAPLPMPIWVYEDGRVISARWTTPDDWTGYIERRLSPEGVELVRAEILAAEPRQDYCRPGGPGGYGYSDGGREVCEHASVDGISLQWEQVYPRLWGLLTGPPWTPPSAWEDPDPGPMCPPGTPSQSGPGGHRPAAPSPPSSHRSTCRPCVRPFRPRSLSCWVGRAGAGPTSSARTALAGS